MIYQMAHCVFFLFFGSLTLLNIEMRDQLGVSGGGGSVKFLGVCVLPISHLLYCTGCAASDGRHRIVELRFGIDGEKRMEKRL